MHIDIPDELNRRLEQLAKGTGQAVDALVCEAIEQRLAREEQRATPADTPHDTGNPEETGPPIWELFADASREIPDEELDRLPTDGSLQHDSVTPAGRPAPPGLARIIPADAVAPEHPMTIPSP